MKRRKKEERMGKIIAILCLIIMLFSVVAGLILI